LFYAARVKREFINTGDKQMLDGIGYREILTLAFAGFYLRDNFKRVL
jgi:hypothetical protein